MNIEKFDKKMLLSQVNWLSAERDRQRDEIWELNRRIERILTHFGLVEHRVNETTLIKK